MVVSYGSLRALRRTWLTQTVRRLINYTPQATMVRLLTINAINAYITSIVLSLAGGFQDTRLLLPGWIGIATVQPPLLNGEDPKGTRANHQNFYVDIDGLLPHYPSKDQHKKRDVDIRQRLLYRQLHYHDHPARTHTPLPARLPSHPRRAASAAYLERDPANGIPDQRFSRAV